MIAVAKDLRDGSRRCDWCTKPIPRSARRDAITCGKACRQARHRFRVEPAAAPAAATRRLRFGYADPPYPDCAQRYYRRAEIDHRDLVARLMREYPDGWALSTSARALKHVLAFCPCEARVGIWVRGSMKVNSRTARNAWEALIVYGGRKRVVGRGQELDDVLVLGASARQRTHPGALVGMKSAAFAEWMFKLLGATAGDELDDLFPGSGVIGRAWKLYTSRAAASSSTPRGATDRVRVRGLAGATQRLAATLARHDA